MSTKCFISFAFVVIVVVAAAAAVTVDITTLSLLDMSCSFERVLVYMWVYFIYTDGCEHQDTRKKHNACSACARLCGRI